MKYQLKKKATSSGADYSPRETLCSRSNEVAVSLGKPSQISLTEMRESNYWLKIFKALDIGEEETGKYLVNESDELKKILGSISSKTSK
jgi:four helix bundle protein